MTRCRFLSAVLALALGMGACSESPTTPTPIAAAPDSTSAPSPGPAGAAPPGQVSGVVVDTEGRPVAGARLTSSIPGVRVDTETDASGAFSFTYHPQATTRFVQVWAVGYEPGGVGWNAGSDPVVLRIVLQPAIRIATGTLVTLSLTNDDKPYYVGEAYDSDYCRPCKLIWISGAPRSATVRWTGDEPLQLWASNGSDVRRAQPDGEHSQIVELAGATHIYVGLPLGDDRKPQQLRAPITVEVTVQ